MNKPQPKIVKKLRSLQEIATNLREGKYFNITRLTMLKVFCRDSDAASQFALFLAKKCPKAIKESGWLSFEAKQQYEWLATRAVRKMTAYLKKSSEEVKVALHDFLFEIREIQNEHKRVKWATVRLIQSRELLVAELALECVLYPQKSSDLGYRIARQFAERYDSRYGTGLVPESVAAVEDIAHFWGQHFLGRRWRERLG